ncbi:MAG: epimerase, partial [Terracidiphilus sp.]
GRSALTVQSPRLRQILHSDLFNLQDLEAQLADFDACFFCLGVSSSGMKEADYERVTYQLTLGVAEALSRVAPGMTFIYVSGAGTDSTEKGRVMWARIKGRTENALLRLPLKSFLFRPGFIAPMDGIESRTPLYRITYKLLAPIQPLLQWALPSLVLSTREIGQSMLAVARHGCQKPVLEIKDIRATLRG